MRGTGCLCCSGLSGSPWWTAGSPLSSSLLEVRSYKSLMKSLSRSVTWSVKTRVLSLLEHFCVVRSVLFLLSFIKSNEKDLKKKSGSFSTMNTHYSLSLFWVGTIHTGLISQKLTTAPNVSSWPLKKVPYGRTVTVAQWHVILIDYLSCKNNKNMLFSPFSDILYLITLRLW